MTRILQLLIFIGLLASCSNNENKGPYADILSKPPYASLTDSISKDQKNDSLYYRRGILLNKNELPEPALADFLYAWSLAKKEAYAFGAGNILLDKKPDSAITFLHQAIQELPNGVLLPMTLARAYEAQQKTDEAIAEIKKVLEKDSSQTNAWILLSDLYLKKENKAESQLALQKAFSLAPNSRDVANKLAYLYAENKNAEALLLADTLLLSDPQQIFAEPLYIKGIYFSNINDKTKALSFFEETIKRDYHFLNAYIEKGKILLERNKKEEALASFQLATTISPSFADGWYWTGRAHESIGQKEEAILDYQRAFSLDPTFNEAREAEKKLTGK